MRAFKLDPITAVIFVSLLLLAALAFLVCLPILGISWAWNSWVAAALDVPIIGFWQAGLLYAALACIIYLSGIVHIEVKTETD